MKPHSSMILVRVEAMASLRLGGLLDTQPWNTAWGGSAAQKNFLPYLSLLGHECVRLKGHTLPAGPMVGV